LACVMLKLTDTTVFALIALGNKPDTETGDETPVALPAGIVKVLVLV